MTTMVSNAPDTAKSHQALHVSFRIADSSKTNCNDMSVVTGIVAISRTTNPSMNGLAMTVTASQRMFFHSC